MLLSNLPIHLKYDIYFAGVNAKNNLKSAKLSFDYNKEKAKGAMKELGNNLPFKKSKTKTTTNKNNDVSEEDNIVEVLDADGNVVSKSTFTEAK